MSPEFERALNEAVARMCGYTEVWIDPVTIGTLVGFGLDKPTADIPRYATDRNALPEVWRAVEDAEQESSFTQHLMVTDRSTLFQDFTAPCWRHCIAALKACNAWTSDLEASWQKEQADGQV